MPVGTIITDVETGERDRRTARSRASRCCSPRAATAASATCTSRRSTNRAPRQKTPGWPGEQKKLQARAARAGRRRPARHAQRRQVDADRRDLQRAAEDRRLSVHDAASRTWAWCASAPEQSFVVADIPGLIEGAAEGAGLGHQFLRHLQRTRLLLHVVDMAPFDDAVDPVAQAKAIVGELKKYDPALYDKPRWLVLNKLDMVPPDEREARVQRLRAAHALEGPGVRDLGADARRLRAAACRRSTSTSLHAAAHGRCRAGRSALRRRDDAGTRDERRVCATRGASSSRSAPAWSPTKAAASTRRRSATGAASWPRWRARAARW